MTFLFSALSSALRATFIVNTFERFGTPMHGQAAAKRSNRARDGHEWHIFFSAFSHDATVIRPGSNVELFMYRT